LRGTVAPAGISGSRFRPFPRLPNFSREDEAITSKVFVGNLSYDTTEDELASLFSDLGQVTEVFIPTDRNTGRPRGFAFVEFSDHSGVEQAIEKLDGHELKGRPIRVSEAQEKPRRAPRGGFDDRPFQGGGPPGGRRSKPKGSRRNQRGKKRSL